ncbi:MAG: 3-dehydroquinate synthase [Acidobacteriota bacterium]
MKTILVSLAERSYPIYVGRGLVRQVGRILEALHFGGKRVVLSSHRILDLHGEPLLRSLRRRGTSVETIGFPEGERYKCLQTAEKLYRKLSRIGADRGTLIIAFGGGVVGDVAGFVAGTFMRGVPYIQIPTTLLAQVDSSIGGKTGVNLAEGKNLVGVFHQPKAVVIDPAVLTTLPRREFQSGLYECVKYGVIYDSPLFELVSRKHARFPERDRSSMESMIFECARIKAEIVSKDERESELRKVLNFGHTLGHAFEAVTHYRLLTHGEAIGHGMILATRLARSLGRIPSPDAERIEQVVSAVSPLPSIRHLRWPEIYRCMLSDKKFTGRQLQFVLPRCIGCVEVVRDLSVENVQQVTQEYLRDQP